MKFKNTVIILLILIIIGALALIYLRYPLKYIKIVEEKSDKYNLDPALVMAVINVESHFNEKAVSNKGAKGLMQITEGTGLWASESIGINNYNDEKLFEPETNIEIGTWYLNKLIQQFDNVDVALAAYNGGSGNVEKWLKDTRYSKDGKTLFEIPFTETKNYVSKVNNKYNIYRKIYEVLK